MCSYPPMSPSRSSADSGSPPPLDHRLAPRNSILIGPTMAQTILLRCSSSDEDAEDEGRMELCTAADEEEGDQSRTDASEDSVEVRVLPIAPNPQSSLLQKNKRKLAEPRKVSSPCKVISRESPGIARHRSLRGRHYSRLPRALDVPQSSIKKHFPIAPTYHPRDIQIPQATMCPFRPWSSESLPERSTATPTAYTPPPTTVGCSQAEPPATLSRLELRGEPQPTTSGQSLLFSASCSPELKQEKDIPEDKEVQAARWEDYPSNDKGLLGAGTSLTSRSLAVRVPDRTEDLQVDDEDGVDDEECDGDVPMALEGASTSSARNADDFPSSSRQNSGVIVASDGKDANEQKNHLRNYKNMTRERRMEANARERTRVHTISAAFDTLRRAVPAYAHNQRLSKLSVLRIACAYIVTLSRVAGKDYSAANDAPSLAECVDSVTRTIQTEGKVRRRRDE